MLCRITNKDKSSIATNPSDSATLSFAAKQRYILFCQPLPMLIHMYQYYSAFVCIHDEHTRAADIPSIITNNTLLFPLSV